MKPASVNNGKVEFPEAASNERMDKWIGYVFGDVLIEKDGNKTNHGWERDLIDCSAKQNAISKKLNAVYAEEKANDAKIAALKSVYDKIFNFRRDMSAVIWSISVFATGKCCPLRPAGLHTNSTSLSPWIVRYHNPPYDESAGSTEQSLG